MLHTTTTGDFTPKKGEFSTENFLIGEGNCEAGILDAAMELAERVSEAVPYARGRIHWSKNMLAALLDMYPARFLLSTYEPPVSDLIPASTDNSACPGKMVFMLPDCAIEKAREAWKEVAPQNPLCSQIRIVRSSLADEVISQTLSDILSQEEETEEELLPRGTVNYLAEEFDITSLDELCNVMLDSVFLSGSEKKQIRNAFEHMQNNGEFENEIGGELLDKIGICTMYIVADPERANRFLNSKAQKNVIEFVRSEQCDGNYANALIDAIYPFILIMEEHYLKDYFCNDFYKNYFASAAMDIVGRLVTRNPSEMEARLAYFESLLNAGQDQPLSDCIRASCFVLRTGLKITQEGHKFSRYFLVQDDPVTNNCE